MSIEDQRRWDARYLEAGSRTEWSVPDGLVGFADLLPTDGQALDVACGAGHGAVWLAGRGLQVLGIDGSPVAIEQARTLADHAGCSDRCEFQVFDFDDGLPDGPLVDVVLCHRFNTPAIDAPMLARLRSGGVLALTVLSEVGAEPGLFRAEAGDLLRRFDGAEVLAHHEADGQATIIVRAAGPKPNGRLD